MALSVLADGDGAASNVAGPGSSQSSISGNPFGTDCGEDLSSMPSRSFETPRESTDTDHVIRVGVHPSHPPQVRRQTLLAQYNEVSSVCQSSVCRSSVYRSSACPSSVDIEAGPQEVVINEKSEVVEDTETRPGFPRRLYNHFRSIYSPIEEPSLVLPVCPNDEEKLSYIYMGRIPFFTFGVISSLALGAGMWLFSITAPYFYWYGLFAGIICIYLIMSYGVGIFGKDFDYKRHLSLVDAHPITEESAPTIDIYLPCCFEPLEILENTYRHISNLDWPASKLKVYVMDDGAVESVRKLAERYGFIYRVREDRPHMRKAGNLRWNFARTDGDFFVIFDADFCPRPDFIKELIIHHIADEKVAIVQSPQWFRSTPDQTWVEQGAGATQEMFYRVIQVNRDGWGGAICVGSNAVYRRAALVEVGGTANIGHSEDVHTGFGAIDRGWKVKYVPLCLATGICPNSPRAFFSQQTRWAGGSTSLLSNPHFWRSKLTLMQKMCYFTGFLFYLTSALNIFIGPIPGILLLALRPRWVKVWNLAFAIPSFIYSLIILPLWASSSYNYNVQHVMTIQSYAYLTAIKDRIFSIDSPWAVSGDTKAHKSNKYLQMRVFCWIWNIIATGCMIGLVTWRVLPGGGLTWYDPMPLLLITAYNLFKTHYFMFCNW